MKLNKIWEVELSKIWAELSEANLKSFFILFFFELFEIKLVLKD